MGEHAEGKETADQEARRRVDWRGGGERVTGLLAGVVRWLGLIFAAILVLHVVFVIGEANQDNGIVSFVRSWADGLSLGFKDLFMPADAKLRVLVNFGIAAIFWMVVSAILAKIIRRIGGGA
jgi:Na+/alanine symporter